MLRFMINHGLSLEHILKIQYVVQTQTIQEPPPDHGLNQPCRRQFQKSLNGPQTLWLNFQALKENNHSM
jgi:hypothetical protein